MWMWRIHDCEEGWLLMTRSRERERDELDLDLEFHDWLVMLVIVRG